MGRKASSARSHGNVKITLRFTRCTDKNHTESASLATAGTARVLQILPMAAHKCACPDCPVPRKRGWKLVLKDITGHLQRGSLTLTNTFDHLKKEDVCLYNPK